MAEREAVEETEQRDNDGSFLPLQLEVDVKSPGHRNYSRSEIQNVCAALFPTVSPRPRT